MQHDYEYNSALTRDIDTWRCPNCNLHVDFDGPPQCTCGYMRPGYICCAWCESYGAIATFTWDGKDPLCPSCVALKQRNTGVPLYLGALALLAAALVLVAIMVAVGR